MAKKRPRKPWWKPAFWLFFAAGCLWVAFMPHHRPATHYAVTVKVQPPIEPLPKPPLPAQPTNMGSQQGGEETEKASPPGPASGVVIPVIPETPAPLVAGARPQIAIVIDDVGVDLKGSERAIHLPPFVTLSFLPYGSRLKEQTKEARDLGHELLLHMPMEPIGHEDPGPGALLVDIPMRDLQQRFETALASFTGFDGVNNHMGSKFTAYPEGMAMVVDELQQRHLFYLDSRTSALSVGKRIAEEKHLPALGRDIFLDDEINEDAVRAQLEATERVARHKGYAVAIGHPHGATMDVLPAWIEEAQKQGFELVPLHTLIKQP